MTISVESPSRPPTHYRLPSGDMMPSIGLGCWQSPPEQLIPAVEHAIKVGYRHIDGATIYGNEEALGEGIRRSGVKREDIWVTTKLWNRQHRPKDVLPACKASLAALGLDSIDLWLMHYPCANDPDSEEYSVIDVLYIATWKAMEECVDLGLVRNIGVSNFSKIELETLLASCRIRPAVHQLERHVYLPQNEFVAWHKEIGLHITSYTPLANTKPSYEDVADLPPIQENATIKRIAKKYGLTPSNILISLQLSEGYSVLPKSVTPSRITENRTVVQLSNQELADIADSCKGLRHRYCDFGEAVGYKYYVGLNDND